MSKEASNTMPLISLMWLIRDARSTNKSERAVLNALALRSNPAKKFLCWPSYRTLADDTQLDPTTVKRAIRSLEAMDLIQRQVRRNRSNRFFLNVSKLIEQREVVRLQAAAEADESIESPYDDVTPHDIAPIDSSHEGWGNWQGGAQCQ